MSNLGDVFLGGEKFEGVAKASTEEFVEESMSEFKGVFDNGFRPEGAREVFVLFDFWCFDLFLLICSSLIPVSDA